MLILLSICIGMTVHAENECIKISMDGEVKQAKDIASGKGISFTLPEITTGGDDYGQFQRFDRLHHYVMYLCRSTFYFLQ